jgi:hypothetical protein
MHHTHARTHHVDRVLVHEVAQHEPHYLQRHAGPAVLEHLQQRQRRDVDGLGGVALVELLLLGPSIHLPLPKARASSFR